MTMERSALITIAPDPFSSAEDFESEAPGDGFYEEPLNKEIVMQYLEGASAVAHPRHKDRTLRLLEIARIVMHDFGLDRNDAYDVIASFNLTHVYLPIDDGLLENIVNVAVDHWTDKQPGWRLYADSTHLSGEYDINSHSYILPLDNPSIVAKAFLRLRCSTCGMSRVRFFQNGYWEWDGRRYTKVEESEIRRRLEEFLEMAYAYSDDGYESYPTKKKLLDEIMDSIQRNVRLPGDIALPYFLGAGEPPEAPKTLILGRTKTLRLEDRTVFDSEPRWFSTGTLDLDPDPNAPEPVEWNKFLDSVFVDDQLSKDLLHEYMGLIVAGDTTFQKMLTMLGETRGGKGTIVGVMEKLVGVGNCAVLTVPQLSEKFGLGGLPGKKLIMMNEAYFSNKMADRRAAVKLLSILGRDMIVIEQKYKDLFSTRIDGLFVMSSNELPDLTNVGPAFSTRFLPLVFGKSFVGSEDVFLEAKLESELPGILNQALDGLERLRARGRFILPPSSEKMLSRMRNRFDPLGAFINELCNRQGRCLVNRLLEVFNQWRSLHDMEPVTASVLGRKLANYPGIQIHQGTGGPRFYEGIELKQALS